MQWSRQGSVSEGRVIYTAKIHWSTNAKPQWAILTLTDTVQSPKNIMQLTINTSTNSFRSEESTQLSTIMQWAEQTLNSVGSPITYKDLVS